MTTLEDRLCEIPDLLSDARLILEDLENEGVAMHNACEDMIASLECAETVETDSDFDACVKESLRLCALLIDAAPKDMKKILKRLLSDTQKLLPNHD